MILLICPAWLSTHSIAQAGLKLEILLPPSLKLLRLLGLQHQVCSVSLEIISAVGWVLEKKGLPFLKPKAT